MEKKKLDLRFILIFAVITGFVIMCTARLFNLQIVNGEEYKETAENRMYRSYPIKAPRGEILDTYGRPLVTNSMGYYVQIQSMDKQNSTLNDTLRTLIEIFKSADEEYVSEFPIEGTPYAFTFKDEEKELPEWIKEQKLENISDAGDAVRYYAERYDIPNSYTEEEILEVVSVRYTMELKNFGLMTPYTFASGISMDTVQKINEQSFELRGVNVEIEPVREYARGSLAAHILGRTGIIYKEEYAELKDKGYGMNDIIGKDGLEKVLEEYLKGKDGYKRVEQTKNGSVSEILNVEQAQSGNYAVLTLDAELQRVTEESLAENIVTARNAKGHDCFSGAAVAVDIKDGGVLAMASLPNYDPADYNKKYDELVNDSKKPLFNRALNGAYTPGSTFKPLTSVAALEEKIITPSTIIEDKGKYTYYAPSYQPTCLIWKSSGKTHGRINVSEAIGVSCNYFFYDVGRRLGIDKLEEYAGYFGLGKTTGIELSESRGIVAGPTYREKLNMEWYPGDTLQAAIGQSDNMYTPAQLVSYISTILNGGKRNALHLVKEVRDYQTGKVVFKNDAETLSEHPISDSTVAAVKDGMRRVVADGTASAVFSDFPIAVGGKTGTAEVSGGSDTVLFVGFAPYDNPQIAVAVVLEHGATSRYAAQVARDMFEYYLGANDVADEIMPEAKLLP